MSHTPLPITVERFDAVLFDLDGVLTDTAKVHATPGGTAHHLSPRRGAPTCRGNARFRRVEKTSARATRFLATSGI
jgi:phosphoglycolate phosphatase-like HAD superfamily hydrolase